MLAQDTQQDRLDKTFLALSNRIRREILSIIRSREISVKDLYSILLERNLLIKETDSSRISMQAVVKHLKVLEKAGLITRSIDAQKRPSKLEASPLKEAQEWLNEYREFWNQSFDKLESLMDELQQ